MWHVVRNTAFGHWVIGAFSYLRDKGLYHIVFSFLGKILIGNCLYFFLKLQGEFIGFFDCCSFWKLYIGNNLVRFVVWKKLYFRFRYTKHYNRYHKNTNSYKNKEVITFSSECKF